MKKILILFSIIVSFEAIAQTTKFDSVIFCRKVFSIPSVCSTPSKSQIFCGDYSMYWFYPGKQMLLQTAHTFIDGMTKELSGCKEDSIKVFLLNQEIPAVKLTCMVNDVLSYQFIAYGIVNGEAVLTILNLWKDPKGNDDLPLPIKQIFKLR